MGKMQSGDCANRSPPIHSDTPKTLYYTKSISRLQEYVLKEGGILEMLECNKVQ